MQNQCWFNAYTNLKTNKRRLESKQNGETKSPPKKKRKLSLNCETSIAEITKKMCNLTSDIQIKQMKCTECFKTFKSQHGLTTHFGMMHTKDKNNKKYDSEKRHRKYERNKKKIKQKYD
eukprot:381336_1